MLCQRHILQYTKMYIGVSKLNDRHGERAVMLGQYILENNATVRAAAKKFGISKSTVHKDVSERLQKIQPHLYHSVQKVLDKNKQERHIRGGMATKMKYEQMKKLR